MMPTQMQLNDFDYELPPELIAQTPPLRRSDSRLLCLDGDTGECVDRLFPDIMAQLMPGDLLVLNDTRVVKARLFGHKATGGQVEMLVERVLSARRCLAQVRANRAPRTGTLLILPTGERLEVVGRREAFFELVVQGEADLYSLIETQGALPLPPYIQRPASAQDLERYQTVYARHPGAVAAPTAGLHFDKDTLRRIEVQGVQIAYVTLHVGAGTFKPVKTQDVREHVMHSERVSIEAPVLDAVRATQARGGKVIAVGTTSVRALESAALAATDGPFATDTSLYIYPGFQFRSVDAMVTNFHLPKSTLLMLVSAFAGRRATLAAYRHAVAERYRFFSYGDAMYVTRRPR